MNQASEPGRGRGLRQAPGPVWPCQAGFWWWTSQVLSQVRTECFNGGFPDSKASSGPAWHARGELEEEGWTLAQRAWPWQAGRGQGLGPHPATGSRSPAPAGGPTKDVPLHLRVGFRGKLSTGAKSFKYTELCILQAATIDNKITHKKHQL